MAETAPAQAVAPTTNAPATPANGATTGAPNAPTDQNVNSRGLPYYEKLRRDLRDTISKKRLMDKSMVSDESHRRARHPSRQSLRSLQSNDA
jgi:chromatin modification-related protein EAF6